ncbi:RimK family alpha-L-glutamate ligase [Streptomyces sp. NPDC058001]|uniref:ATP-grasp domain-containing protein n=1 Tax=Streptomyces sp. NPDC058001 TaxID=3346300 RepID=UPI0036E9A0F9
MRIRFITHGPDHPLIAATAALLTPRHQVDVVDPALSSQPSGRVDVCLLKARTPSALDLAQSYEAQGAVVLNSAAATALCQDRTEMDRLARSAGLPFAATRTVADLARLTAEGDLPYPLVVKSRHSRRDDLVARVDDIAALRELSRTWPHEPVVVQEFARNGGWDHKLWVIGDDVFAGLRRSELAVADTGPTLPLTEADLPDGWAELARAVGSVFALDVYGVDVVETVGGAPLIVDINAFPGMRGQTGPPRALAALALRAGTPPGLGRPVR